jgi:hypothetical protein
VQDATTLLQDAPAVIRHGTGDGVVTLNVGGTEFITLRSTIQMNSVLHTRVLMAEANQEFTKGAVFIDRAPTQFLLILQHLRNRADMVQTHSFANTKFWKKNQVLIQIPKDRAKMRDLFVEAKYFKIEELEHLLCSYDIWTQFSNFIGGGSGNPFYAASEAIKTARRALMATSGVGLLIGTQNDKLMNDCKELVGDVMGVFQGRFTTEDVSKKIQNHLAS